MNPSAPSSGQPEPLKNLLRPDAALSDAVPDMKSVLLMTDADELDCDETCEWLDQYAEGLERQDDVAALFPLVHRHLRRGCPDCNAELRVLRAAMASGGQP